jgi:hypothetical protein
MVVEQRARLWNYAATARVETPRSEGWDPIQSRCNSSAFAIRCAAAEIVISRLGTSRG